MYIFTKTYNLNSFFSYKGGLLFLVINNLLLLGGLFGLNYIFLPSLYFFKINDNFLSFIFLTYYFYKSFISHFFSSYKSSYFYYFIRFKIKGLGYQI